MVENQFNTPILFLIFNRPDTTERVFSAIREIQPKQLFIAGDGPRDSRPEDVEKCKQTREIISHVDWPCEVKTLFRDKNLGCKIAVSSAIDWFFENVEEGIILEDDCLPDQSFFPFCEELLNKYADNEKVMMIGGSNFLVDYKKKKDGTSYYFSKYSIIWGWATWRRAWKHYDVNLKNLHTLRGKKVMETIFKNKNEQKYWLNIFELVYYGKIDTWDYQWVYTVFSNNALTIVPNVNMISNIGFGRNSTHTKNKSNPLANLKIFAIDKIVHPNSIIQDKDADKYVYRKNFNPRKIVLFYKRILTVFSYSGVHKIINKILTKNAQNTIKNEQ